MMNNDFPNIAKEYKRTIAGRFMLVEGAKLKDKLSGEDFLVTKKMSIYELCTVTKESAGKLYKWDDGDWKKFGELQMRLIEYYNIKIPG